MLRLAQLAHCPERLRVSRLAICYVKTEFTARLSLQFRRSECSISDALNAARPFPCLTPIFISRAPSQAWLHAIYRYRHLAAGSHLT